MASEICSGGQIMEEDGKEEVWEQDEVKVIWWVCRKESETVVRNLIKHTTHTYDWDDEIKHRFCLDVLQCHKMLQMTLSMRII